MTNNLIYRITGDNPDHLKTFTPYCRKKISMLAGLLLLITTVWLVCGYLIARELLNCSLISSIAVGLVCGGIIFFLERAIILLDGNTTILLARLILAFVVACLSSFIVDALVLKNDTDLYIKQKYQAASENAKNGAIISHDKSHMDLKNKVENAYKIWQMRTDEYNGEVQGTSGTHIPGHSKAAQAKQAIMNDAKAEYSNLSSLLLLEEKQTQNAGDEAYLKQLGLSGEATLLHRIELMHDMVMETTTGKILYMLFFSIAFILELMIVIIKTYAPQSAYEEDQQLLNNMLASKRKRMMEEDEYLNRLGIHGRNAKSALHRNQGNALLN